MTRFSFIRLDLHCYVQSVLGHTLDVCALAVRKYVSYTINYKLMQLQAKCT